MKHFAIFLVLLSLGFASSVTAHQPMANKCVVPVRPVDDQNDNLWQNFLDEIDTFQACINAGVEHHQDASTEHQQAARRKVGRWNLFVKESLNVPQDFPWKPKTD